MGALGLSGILLFCSGAYVLWQSQKEVLDWLREFFRIFRNEFSRRGNLSPANASAQSSEGLSATSRARQHSGALRLVGGVGLMVLGQVLFFLDLAF